MEIKVFGNSSGKKIMLLHGNLMCYKQYDEIIPLLEKQFLVYAVSFDGFDGTGKTTYHSADEQAEKLATYIKENCGGQLDLVVAESLGCAPAVILTSRDDVAIYKMILGGPECLDFGKLNGIILKIMPHMQWKMAKRKTMPSWALKFMGQTKEGMDKMLCKIPDYISEESIRATWKVGLYLYRREYPVRKDTEVAVWYGEREGHMEKAIEKLSIIYPRLSTVKFAGYGHGEYINHPKQFVDELKKFSDK